MTEEWLENALEQSQLFERTDDEAALVGRLLDIIYSLNPSRRMIALGAAYDLLVATEYYGQINQKGWLHCDASSPFYILPYTNTCPRCVLNGVFHFHRGNKPGSGSIGKATSRLLAILLESLLARNGKTIEVRRGREPIDVIFVDRSTTPTTLFFTEIKASPLVTLPLIASAGKMQGEVDDHSMRFTHTAADAVSFHDLTISLLLPVYAGTGWQSQVYSLGRKASERDVNWAYRGMLELLKDEHFFSTYFSFWYAALDSYADRDGSTPIYWLTNGCGQPAPRPADWPRRRIGTGYESVSDSKSSVGMDRTDDIKKATYQVLKLGAEGKPSITYDYKVGIVSNVHPLRHGEAYLAALRDVVWTRDPTRQVQRAADLSPETVFFNLFDGLVTLTRIEARDQWVRDTFRF